MATNAELQAQLKDLTAELEEKKQQLVIIVDDRDKLNNQVRELLARVNETEEENRSLNELLIAASAEPLPDLSAADEKLIAEACEKFGIGDEFVLAANVDRATGQAVVVTVGGTKVRFGKGDKVEPLHHIRVTGINPDAKKRKPVVGKKR